MNNTEDREWRMSAEDCRDQQDFRSELAAIKARRDIDTSEKMRLMREVAIRRSRETLSAIEARMVEEGLHVVNSRQGVAMSVEDAISMLEDDNVMDAMSEKYGSNNGPKMH